MTTPNEDLILKLRGQAYTTCRPDQLCDQAADLLQSQAELIAELEEQLAGRTDYALSLRRRLDTARMESHILRAQLTDAELHTKQVERGLDKATAQLAAIAATEPVAYLYEMATTMMTPGSYGGWVLTLEYQKPCVPDGAVRNLQELFTHPMPAESNAELVEALEALIESITGVDQVSVVNDARTALSKYKGAK